MVDDTERRRRRMEEIDRLLPEMRMLVKEEGWTIVKAFIDCGVLKPRQIRHLIGVVRAGSFDGGVNPLQRERDGYAGGGR